MDLKHRVSLMDIVDDLEKGILPSQKTLDDKMDDLHNYLLLLEGLIVERMDARHGTVKAYMATPGEADGTKANQAPCSACMGSADGFSKDEIVDEAIREKGLNNMLRKHA